MKGFTSEVQLTQERNLYQKATVKQFTSEVNRPSLPSLFHHGVHLASLIAPMSNKRSEPVGSPVRVVKICFAYVVKPFTGEVVKVCSGSKSMHAVIIYERREGYIYKPVTT